MLTAFWQRLDQGARLSMPFATAFLFALISAIPWPLPWLGGVAPPLALVAIYYWTVHRPDLFWPSMAFAIGFLNDIIHMLPLGLSAFVFVAAHHLVLTQRRFFVGHAFFMLWWGFALTMAVVMLTMWGLQCLIRWSMIPFLPVLLQAVLAIILFPLPAWLLIRLQRAVLSHV